MRCLSAKEAVDLLGRTGFSVLSNPAMWRAALVLEPKIASRQARVGGRSAPDVTRLAHFAEALNRWYPPDLARVLWVDSCNWYFPSTYELFIAARLGLGDTRSLLDAPGHY